MRETFVDEHSVSNKQPYLFNGKELDFETGLYYYGARYYDAKTSLWLNTDPLSGYNPIQEVEHYIDGQHNGGIFNPMNMATYSYTYQNPVVFVDPNGKQVYFIHGTWSNSDFIGNNEMRQIAGVFGQKPISPINWSGCNNHEARVAGAYKMLEYIGSTHNFNIGNNHEITLVGHSHGGNVAILVANMLKKSLGDRIKVNLLTINTPVRPEYQLQDSSINHYNVYNNKDRVQTIGGTDTEDGNGNMKGGAIFRAGRRFEKRDFINIVGAKNIEYTDQFSSGGCGWSHHCGQEAENVKVWLPKLEKQIKKE